MHFYLPIAQARLIYQGLRQKLPGWAIPQYVIDIPEGHGKTPAYNPEDYQYSGTLISKDGRSVDSREPDFFV
jgi:lysine 2,3-aminomutase